MKQIKDNTHGWRDITCSCVEKISTVKMTLLPKAVYKFSAIPVKLLRAFFTELEQMISQLVWKHKRPLTGGCVSFPAFRLYCKAIVIQTVWYWHKNRNTDR